MTGEAPARAVWRGPIRSTHDQAEDDSARVLGLILKHAPDLAPPGVVEEPKPPDRPIPGAHTWGDKSRG